MISLERRKEAVIQLGEWLSDFMIQHACRKNGDDTAFSDVISKANHYNQWIAEPFIIRSMHYWIKRLSRSSIETFLKNYPGLVSGRVPGSIAVIPRENEPFAGFHDLICILLSGHRFVGRNKNHASDLLWYLTQKLIAVEPGLIENIQWCEQYPKTIDKYLIHASSFGNETWKEYMRKKDSLIRNQTLSVAIITPNDRASDFENMATDIFDFFGQSVYNIRKLFVPDTFSIETFFPAMEKCAFVYQYNRYANNYDYQRSVLLMDQKPFFENGFLVLRQTSEHAVPIGCLHFDIYTSEDDLMVKINNERIHIQQIITTRKDIPEAVRPGEALSFQLNSYEDHLDTMHFLMK